MMTITRRHILILALVAAITYAGSGFACNGDSNNTIKSFRLALVASGPLVNSLVVSGAIPQSRATAIIADFDAGAQCGLALQQDFAAVEDNSPTERSEKLVASQKAFRCFRAVVARQNFSAHPRLLQAVSIAEGILASLVVFYSDTGTGEHAMSPELSAIQTKATISAKTEADLERQMKTQMKLLEAAMKP